MIQKNKVRTMTRAAIFEQEEQRGAMYTTSFFCMDYIVYGLIKSAISVTFAALLVFVAWGLYHSEELMTEKSVSELLHIGIQVLKMYGVALAVFLVISLIVSLIRYSKATRKMKEYRTSLRKLMKTYQSDTDVKE